MALYAELFDGTRLEFPDNTDPAVIDRVAREETAKRQPKGESGFIPAAKATIQSTLGGAALLGGKLGLYTPEEAQQKFEAREAEARRIFAPTENWSDGAFTKFKELLGGSVPLMVAPIAAAGAVAALPLTGPAAVAAGLGAAGLASATQFTMSNLSRQMETAKSLDEASLGAAAVAAAPQALLDVFAFRAYPLIKQLFTSVGKEITEEAAQNLAKQGITNTIKDYAVTTGKTAGVEGLTESGQSFLERLQAGLNIADSSARAEYLDSFIGGAVLGGTLAPVGRYVERQKQVEEPLAPGQRAGESLEQTAQRLNADIQQMTAPPEKSLFLSSSELASMAAEESGYGKLVQYAERIKQEPDSPEKQASLEAAIELRKRIVSESEARQTPTDKPYPFAEEPEKPIYLTGTGLIDLVNTKETPKDQLVSLLEYISKTKKDPESPERDQSVEQARTLYNLLQEEAKSRGFDLPEAFTLRATDLRAAGIPRSDPVYDQVKDKDLNNPDEADFVVKTLEEAQKRATPDLYDKLEGVLDSIDRYLESRPGSGFYAQRTYPQPSGEGVAVAGRRAGEQPPAEGLAAPQRGGVAPATEPAEQPVPAEEVQPVALKDPGAVAVEPAYEPGLDARPEVITQLEEELRKAETERSELEKVRTPSLFQFLRGKIEFSDVKDITPLKAAKEQVYRFLIDKSGRGKPVSELVNDGMLDVWLPPNMRHDSVSYDQQESTEYIKERLRQRNFVPYHVEAAIKELNLTIDEIDTALRGEYEIEQLINEANAELESAARDREAEIIAPEAEARGAKGGKRTKERKSLAKVAPQVSEAKFKQLEQRAKTAKEPEAKAPEARAPELQEKIDQLQGVLSKILAKYGLKDVKINLEEGMADEGSYSGQLIKLALDLDNPVRTLRHEAIHALKELGFFTPQQWKVLTDRAQKEWIEKYLKDQKAVVDGKEMTRYDAYMQIYDGDMNAIVEESIADAFADFSKTQPPAGMMRAILNRMQNLFKAIKQAMNVGGYDTAEDVFGAVEKGDLPAPPSVAKAPPAKKGEKASLRSPIGLYSELENKLEAVDAKQAPAAQWKTLIKALPQKGIKPEEIEWSGVNDWLDLQAGKVRKEDLLDYLRANGVRVEEVVLGGRTRSQEGLTRQIDELRNKIIAAKEEFQGSGYLFREIRGDKMLNDLPFEWQLKYDKIVNQQEILDDLEKQRDNLSSTEPSKYGAYTLPFGTNYREVLLTLPTKVDVETQRLLDEEKYLVLTPEQQKKVNEAKQKSAIKYTSSHWEQPNVIAHIRLNDRTDADGNKVLFVEEIQSDWGQEGKKKGFAGPKAVVRKGESGGYEVVYPDGQISGELPTRRIAEEEAESNTVQGVPSAPFVSTEKFAVFKNNQEVTRTDKDGKEVKQRYDSMEAAEAAAKKVGGQARSLGVQASTEGWLSLALKRVMVMAAEGGYDKVAFVNGDQSAGRYDLSKQVSRIVWNKKTGDFAAQRTDYAGARDDRPPIKYSNVDEKKLEELIGKEAAKKLIDAEEIFGYRGIAGDDLKVGGEGMKAFYDKIVPNTLKNLLPKVGGEQMKMVAVNMSPEFKGPEAPAAVSKQPGFDVTPSMTEKVTTTGLPKFSLRAPDTPQFKSFFGQSKIVNADGSPKLMYHGTARDITEFRPKQAGAIFVTDNPKFAETFASTSAEWMAKHADQFLTAEQYKEGKARAVEQIKKDYKADPKLRDKIIDGLDNEGSLYRSEALEILGKQFKDMLPSGPNIMPVYIRAENPFDYENKDHINALKEVEALLRYSDKSISNYIGFVQNGSWEEIESPRIQDVIKQLGFDGFYIKEGGQKNLAVYSPNQIKSAIGNEGTFDFRSPDIRKSLRPLPTLSSDVTDRIKATIVPRYRAGYVERILDAISPKQFSKFRKEFINRYDIQAKFDREAARQIKLMGGKEQLADAKAEPAALFADLGGGLAASAMGVNDRKGGIPVYVKKYVVEKDFLELSTHSTKAAADAAAKKVPGAKVYEQGYTKIVDKAEGLLPIFQQLATYAKPKLGEPDAYSQYQFWADVKRTSKYILNPGTGKYEEKLFTKDDIKRANEIEKAFPEFVEIQKKWIAYNNGLVDFMRDTGVVSEAGAKEMKKHGDYFPLYRHLGEDDIQGPRLFTSIANVQGPKAAKGSESEVTDFFETIVRNTQSAIQAGIKNIAARRATDQAMRIGEVVKLDRPQSGPTVYRVLEDGKETYYQTRDPMFIESLKSLYQPDIPFIGLLSTPARILRNLVTKDPAFQLANMMRDSLSAYVASGFKFTPIVATLKQYAKAIADKSPEMRELRSAGVIGGYDYSQGVETSAKKLEAEIRKAAKARTTMEKLTSPATTLWGALEKSSEASDSATRQEIYKKVLEQTGNEAEALYQALEIMNFNRKGRSPIIRILTAAVPFMNARIQGLDVLYRSGMRPLSGDATEAEKKRMNTFWVRGMMLMALSSMYWLLTHDDEEYKAQEQETRDNYWLFPSAGVKIPIPFEIGVMFKVIPERILEYAFGSDTGKDFLKSMERQVVSTFAFNLIPQTFLPYYEVKTNYSFFTQRPIISPGMENISPEYQVGPNTSKVAGAMGQALNISPIKLDYLIQGYTGTMGMYVVNLLDAFFDMNSEAPKASRRLEQMPVLKRFMVDPEARGSISAYYDLKNSVDEVVRTSNFLQRSMDFENYGQYMQENVQMLAVKDYINDLEKTMKEYREMKNLVRISNMDADSKRDTLSNIGKLEQQLTKNIQTLKKQIASQ